MRKAIGEERCFYFDQLAENPNIEEGDYLQTSRGHTYLVTKARLLLKGPYAGSRTYLHVVIVPAESIPVDAVVRGIHWPRE